jgi:two-component system, NarL family, sensor kinase
MADSCQACGDTLGLVMESGSGASDPGAPEHLVVPRPRSQSMGRRPVVQEILRFVIGGLLAAVLVGVGTFIVISRDAENQAIGHATDITTLEARGIAQPNLPANLLTVQRDDWDPNGISSQDALLRVFDRIVRTRILNPDVTQGAEVVRVKIWNADGTIVYSDIHQLIDRRFPLGAREVNALQSGTSDADVSDLTKPENQFERDQGKLLEVYVPIDFNGQKLLFETYQKYDAITQYQQSIWSSFLPVFFAGLLVLFLVQIPLAVRLARRLHSSLMEREALLKSAIHASERERQHIAQDLHDGVVQDLSAVKLSLGTMIRRVKANKPGAPVENLENASSGVGKAIQELRTLIVEIAPPSLTIEGIGNAIADLLEPLEGQGIQTRLDSNGDIHLSEPNLVMLFRVAQEVIRNVTKYSSAKTVSVRLTENGGRVRLEIADDGVGFSNANLVQRRSQGHVGLMLLTDLVADIGGSLEVHSEPGKGTSIVADVPAYV